MGEMADYDAGDGIDDWPEEARVEFDSSSFGTVVYATGGVGGSNVAVGGNGPPIKVQYSLNDWFNMLIAARKDYYHNPNGFERGAYDNKYPKAIISRVMSEKGRGDMRIDIEARVQQVLEERQVQAEVEKRLKLIEAYGEDNFPEGAVIRFKKQFRPDSTAYSYAAIKVNGQWYTSGPKSTRAYSWLELVAWLVAGVPVTNIEKMIPANEEGRVRVEVAEEDATAERAARYRD
jgi:hypothetical protein